MTDDPHRDAPVLRSGASLEDAAGAVILLHGRGGSAEDILSIGREIYLPQLAYLAPQAVGNAWYPNSFLSPIQQNEPWLSSALRKVESIIELAQDAGIAAEHVVLCGFSQGACLATEFTARHPRRYAGLIAFTGGLVGPLDADLKHEGDLKSTPVFFGSGDPDPYIPWQRVEQSANVLAGMGAQVTKRRYPGRPHTVGVEELGFANRLVRQAFGEAAQ